MREIVIYEVKNFFYL